MRLMRITEYNVCLLSFAVGFDPCCRALNHYQERTAAEGEYTEEELPADLIDGIEKGAGADRQHFAVSSRKKIHK